MMKATLPRVGCIGLLGSPLDVSLQRALSLCLLGHIQLDSLFYAKRPNAANQPPRTQPRHGQVSRMKATLFAVGCIGLFGSDPTPPTRGAHPSRIAIRASTQSTPPHCHVTQLSKQRGARQPARHATPAATSGALSRQIHQARLISFVRLDARGKRE
jgi:hypothetical protein